MGKKLAKKLGLAYEEKMLTRVGFSSPQVGLSPKQRSKNIKAQFAASPGAKNKNIIIVDDVWTTGNTLKEAAQTLKTVNASQVWGVTFCRSVLK